MPATASSPGAASAIRVQIEQSKKEAQVATVIRSVTDLREHARGKASGEMREEEFRSRLSSLVGQLPVEILEEHRFFFLPATMPPWFDTGLDLRRGESITVFAAGRTYLSRELEIWLKPNFQLWYRIGEEGLIFRGARCSHTFVAGSDGRLFLAGYYPGEWASNTGALAVPAEAYQQAEGGMSVLVMRWAVDPLVGLAQLARLGDFDSFAASEIDRLSAPIEKPDGWEYLAPAPLETYTSVSDEDQGRVIACYIHDDAVILRKDVVEPFTSTTRLRWSWKIDALPSRSREDELPTHDYLSIAVEFDNGQDLTYFWSAELDPETCFRCPIPSWHDRETHVVVRSGHNDLGRWITETRNVYADYQRCIGEPPSKIVRVWLIAVSLFRHQEGQCTYGRIELLNEGRTALIN